MMINKKHILFDFDGVILESNDVRFDGFKKLFNYYPDKYVEELINYCIKNGGASRYEKIRYFFNLILKEHISSVDVNILADRYGNLVKQKVIDSKFVKGSLKFLRSRYSNYDFAIVSGSDQRELINICEEINIHRYFERILGSPESKEINIKNLLLEMEWDRKSCVLIGDSINDLEVAEINEIDFIARDSGLIEWKSVFKGVIIKDLTQLLEVL